MNRKFRLRKSADFKRVRRLGKSLAHPLLVLVVRENQLTHARVAVSAGRSLGGAVQRNRAKRRIRAVTQPLLKHLQPGNDIILIARKPILDATFQEIQKAVYTLLHRSELIVTHE